MLMLSGRDDCCYVSQPAMLSRFLYPNPVCLLTLTDGNTVTSHNHETGCTPCVRNVMTVSWLMPVDNQANVLLSINTNRFTAEKMSSLPIGSPFVLNIPCSEHQGLILQIGKCSGRTVDKFASLGIATCFPGWRETVTFEDNDDNDASPRRHALSKKKLKRRESALLASKTCAISCCVAHLVCTIVKCSDSSYVGFSDSDHIILSANISCAYVKSEYWNNKQFASLRPDTPPILSFLGSGEFAHIVKQDYVIPVEREKEQSKTCIDNKYSMNAESDEKIN